MTTTLEQWKELEAALANATGSDEYIDRQCYNICRGKMLNAEQYEIETESLDYYNSLPSFIAPSSSIDAALAFARTNGWEPITLDFSDPDWVFASLKSGVLANMQFVSACAKTAPIAILRAVCAAKIKETEK